jgi:hypothetical protein
MTDHDERKATFCICDEVLISLNGKFNALGMYISDIAIPVAPSTVSQLVFLFHIECSLADPFRSLTAEIILPGEEPRRMPVPFKLPQLIPRHRTRFNIRWPFLIQLPVLRPGRIEAKVIHDKGEIIAGYQWIVMRVQAQEATTTQTLPN